MAIPKTTRRDILKMGGAAALATLPGHAGVGGERRLIARGVVFEDRSNAGVRRPGDKGIQGVLVSNGRDVVKTDEAGRYALPVEDGSAIFVIKPSGWMTPVDPQTNLPRFYHIHQPEGSPAELGLHYRGMAPTGPLPESLDFPLRRVSESDRFDVLMLADPQPADLAELDFLRDSFLARLAATDAAFAITLGDVMSDNLDLYERYNEMMAQAGLPIWNAPGNHDLNYEAPDRRFARETWKRVFGPPHFAFEHGRATFIVLDNVDWRRTPPGLQSYRGGIGEAQLAFVENLLEHTPGDRLIVLCMHIPLISADRADRGSNTADRDALLALLGDRPAVSFSGHMHTAEHHYVGDRRHHHQILTALSGSWWSGPLDVDGLPLAQCSDGAPNGFYILSIDGDRYSTRFVSREASSLRVVLAAPGAPKGSACVSRRVARETEIVANLFDGGPRCDVRFSIDGRSAASMQRVARPDPFTQDLYARNSGAIKYWVGASDSSHVWAARLPSLPAGFHKLKVEARDEFGRAHAQTLVFEVA